MHSAKSKTYLLLRRSLNSALCVMDLWRAFFQHVRPAPIPTRCDFVSIKRCFDQIISIRLPPSRCTWPAGRRLAPSPCEACLTECACTDHSDSKGIGRPTFDLGPPASLAGHQHRLSMLLRELPWKADHQNIDANEQTCKPQGHGHTQYRQKKQHAVRAKTGAQKPI